MCLAIPGLILEINGTDELTRMARVSFAGVIKEASLAYTPEAQPGDYVLVHAGFAIHKWERSEVEEFEAIRAGLDPEELPA